MSKRESRLVCFYSSIIKLNRIATFILFCAALVCLQPKCPAQVLYGSLTGNVTDPSGAAVSGAKVEALDIGKGVAQEAAADVNGIYRFVALLPGTYKVTISAPNFEMQVTLGVRVAWTRGSRSQAPLKM